MTHLSEHEIELNRNWTFAVNGRPVFAHGANWVPCDMRISECTAEDYEYLQSVCPPLLAAQYSCLPAMVNDGSSTLIAQIRLPPLS